MYRVETTPEFDEDLSDLGRAVAQRVIRKVEWLAEHPEVLRCPLRHLPEDLKGLHKYRVGDYRVLLWEAKAVAQAAIETGVARKQINIDEYSMKLESLLGRANAVMRTVINYSRKEPKRIVFPEGENKKILYAAQNIRRDKIGVPVLLGDVDFIKERAHKLDINLDGVELIDPKRAEDSKKYADKLHQLRRRHGMTRLEALVDPVYYGLMMLHEGDVDAFVAGAAGHYPDVLRPVLEVFPKKNQSDRIAAMSIVLLKEKVFFFADTAVNINPTAEQLADIAVICARQVSSLGITPRVALLSYSNFGSAKGELAKKMQKAVQLYPKLEADGEMQADTAVTADILKKVYPFSDLKEPANVLIFPDLQSGNIAYKLIQRLGGAEIIGPLLIGAEKPIQLLQVGSYTVRDIVHLSAYAVMEAQGMFQRELFKTT